MPDSNQKQVISTVMNYSIENSVVQKAVYFK